MGTLKCRARREQQERNPRSRGKQLSVACCPPSRPTCLLTRHPIQSTRSALGAQLSLAEPCSVASRASQTAAQRERVLWRWYRERFNELVPRLLEKWQARLGVKVGAWGIKKMKTKWGSCNAQAKRIWLKSELAKKPSECLDYIIVHEMAHLLVRRHDERFFALLDRHLPKWRATRKLLNAAPLGHAEWAY